MADDSNPDAPLVSAVAYKWQERNVFNAISEDRVPSDKLFNRPHYFAILDKLPVTPGHSLMITKHHAATMFDGMPPEALNDTMGDLQVRLLQSAAAPPAAAAAAATAAPCQEGSSRQPVLQCQNACQLVQMQQQACSEHQSVLMPWTLFCSCFIAARLYNSKGQFNTCQPVQTNRHWLFFIPPTPPSTPPCYPPPPPPHHL